MYVQRSLREPSRLNWAAPQSRRRMRPRSLPIGADRLLELGGHATTPPELDAALRSEGGSLRCREQDRA